LRNGSQEYQRTLSMTGGTGGESVQHDFVQDGPGRYLPGPSKTCDTLINLQESPSEFSSSSPTSDSISCS
jgi:hypothetical protein